MLKFYYFMVGFKSRRNYWSCSAFATWCNKTFGTRDKPKAGTLKEFYDYKTSAKTVSPILYWFVETFLDTIQDIIYFPKDVLYHIKYKFANRFISKTHVISTTLPVGDWHDCDSRISSGLFLLIVNFVEKEKAHMHRISMGGPKKTNREDGIAYLDWEIGLGDDGGTDQVASAIEIKEIYSWIKDVYPNRTDPYDASGWTEYTDSRSDEEERDPHYLLKPKTHEEQEIISGFMKKVNKMTTQHDDEETDILIRIIKLRKNLWT